MRAGYVDGGNQEYLLASRVASLLPACVACTRAPVGFAQKATEKKDAKRCCFSNSCSYVELFFADHLLLLCGRVFVPLLISPPPFAAVFELENQRKRKADGGFATSTCSSANDGGLDASTSQPPQPKLQLQKPSRPQSGDSIGEAERRALAERATREASRKLGRETLDRLKRCNVPPAALSEHDVDDRDDPSSCAEYVMDMYKRFKELEVRREEAQSSGKVFYLNTAQQ